MCPCVTFVTCVSRLPPVSFFNIHETRDIREFTGTGTVYAVCARVEVRKFVPGAAFFKADKEHAPRTVAQRSSDSALLHEVDSRPLTLGRRLLLLLSVARSVGTRPNVFYPGAVCAPERLFHDRQGQHCAPGRSLRCVVQRSLRHGNCIRAHLVVGDNHSGCVLPQFLQSLGHIVAQQELSAIRHHALAVASDGRNGDLVSDRARVRFLVWLAVPAASDNGALLRMRPRTVVASHPW